MPVFSFLYVAHRRYRQYRPRRLPYLTPLTLPGFYLTLATVTYSAYYSVGSFLDVAEDKDLLTIHLASDVASLIKQEQRATLRNDAQRVSSYLKNSWNQDFFIDRIRSCMWLHCRIIAVSTLITCSLLASYTSAGPLGKLFWYHHHVWSDQLWWTTWGAAVVGASLQTGLTSGSISDFDAVITYLANASSGRVSDGCDRIWQGLIFMPVYTAGNE